MKKKVQEQLEDSEIKNWFLTFFSKLHINEMFNLTSHPLQFNELYKSARKYYGKYCTVHQEILLDNLSHKAQLHCAYHDVFTLVKMLQEQKKYFPINELNK